MKESLVKIASDSKHVNSNCNLCEEQLQVGDDSVACPRCHKVHHADCWKKKGGCATPGCPQVAKTVIGEKPEGDGLPPPIPKWYFAVGAALIVLIITVSALWPEPPDPAMGRARITVMDETYLELEMNMTDLVEEFNDTNEEIYIDLQLLPTGGGQMKVVVLIAAGDAPDVFSIDDERLALFTEQEALLQLGEDETGQPIYSIQHPAELSKFVVWGGTEYPEESLEVLHYLVENIPPVDLDMLRELRERRPTPMPMTGF